MKEQDFQRALPQIKKILKFVLENPYSDFYRRKYEGLGVEPEKIKTYKDFCRIPALTKDEILLIPTTERSFCDPQRIFRYGISSGTTNQNRPLVLPHQDISERYQGNQSFTEPFLKSLGVQKVFGLLPINSVIQEIILEKNRTIPVIPVDVTKLDLAVSLAAELKPEAIISSPTILYAFTEKAKAVGLKLNKVKWVSIGSEFCTRQKFNYFKEQYPAATFVIRYGNSEAGNYLGYRCAHLRENEENPQIFHPSDINLIEVIADKNLGADHGDVIFTHLYPEGFPLIRYLTGDSAKEQSLPCPCGQNRLIDNSGKKEFDVLKTSGVIIHTQAIANALESIESEVSKNFQMHVYEETKGDRIRTRLLLELMPLKSNLISHEIAHFLEKQLQLSFNKTLFDLIEEDYFAPLEVKFVTKIENGSKSKNIISHLLEV